MQPVVVPRWIQLVLLPLAILGLYELAKGAGSVLVVLIAACVIALILNPLTKRIQRVIPRGLAIVALVPGRGVVLRRDHRPAL